MGGDEKDGRTPAERLTAVFADVLRLGPEDVAQDASFFDLGGDSLLSIEAVAAAGEAGIALSLEQLYRAQTVRSLLDELAAAPHGDRAVTAAVPDGAPPPALPAEDLRRLPADVADAFPASALQQGMILHASMTPDSTAYHDVALYRVGAALDLAALRSAAADSVAAHPTLRSGFDLSTYSEPLQLVRRGAPIEVAAHDHRALGAAERRERYDRWVRDERSRPFDVAVPPLARLAAFDEGADGFVLGISFHHAILDGLSLARWVRTLLVDHQALAAGRPLPPRAGGGTAAQREAARREKQSAPQDLHWWREHLRDTAMVRIPRTAADDGPTGPGRLEAVLDSALAARLAEVCRDHRVRLKHLGLGVHQWVLGQLSGQDDVTTGLIVNVRPEQNGSTDALGLFLNTVPFRTRLGGADWLELARRARAEETATLSRRHVPYAAVRRALGIRGELTDTTFNYVRYQDFATTARLIGADVTSLRFHEEATFPLSTYFAEDAANPGLGVVLHYDRSLTGDEAASRIMDLYLQGLRACAADPTAPSPEPGAPLPGGGPAVPHPVDQVAEALGLTSSDLAVVSPVNATQRDLYLDHLRDPAADRYRLAFTAKLGPVMDLPAWRQAVTEATARHPALRMRCAVVGDQPYLCTLTAGHGPAPRAVPGDGAEHRSLDDAVEDARAPYRMDRDLLVRHDVARAGGQWYAVLGAHHLVLDVAGAHAVFGDIFRAYTRLAGPALDSAGRHRIPRAARQEPEDTEPVFDAPAALVYWRTVADRVTTLDVVPPPASTKTAEDTAEERAVLSGDTLRLLRLWCRRHGTGLSSALLASYALVLGHCFGASGDFLVHQLLAGRGRAREAAGARYHVVPCVIPWTERHQHGFARRLAGRLHEQRRALGPRAYVSVLQQRRLFPGDTRFFFNHYPTSALHGPAGAVRLRVHESYPDDEMHLLVEDFGHEVELTLRYSPSRFPALDLAGRTARVAASLHPEEDCGTPAGEQAAEPADVPLVSAAEREDVLFRWNRTEVPVARTTVHELVLDQARATPEAVAVHGPATRTTYRQLVEEAQGLAATLQRHGAGPGATIGILAPRTPHLVTAVLATLLTGAAYTPLDPDYPSQRLRHMIDDAGITTLLTHHDQPPLAEGTTHIPIDTPHTGTPHPTPVHPHDLAYTIYTSGSTGTPKGAMNQHDGVVNRLLWMRRAFDIGPDDAVLQKTPMSFDVSVWEFLLPLISGARLVPAEPGGHRDPLYLVDVIGRQRITTVHFVPSMLRYFLAAVPAEGLPHLRRIICSGEALPPDLRDLCHEKLPGVSLSNLYGPTEAAVDVTAWHCPPGASGPVVPIGRPVDNTRTYVLDTSLAPLPAGAAGELFLGGIQVGRGYLTRPGLTAERFLPDPYAPAPGARMYRTGDRARWLPDGSLECLGRLDHQVKIRGFRIELGEIEAALRDQPGVREAAVAVHATVPDHPQLVAYVCGGPPEAELRAALAGVLPAHMLPSHYEALAELPLSPNGKLDRRALPAPRAARAESTPDTATAAITGSTAFADAAEESIAAVWHDVLGRTDIGRQTNFFEAGGDSLLLLRVRGRLALALDAARSLSPVDLFDHPTIASLAALLARGAGRTGVEDAAGRGARRRTLPRRAARPARPPGTGGER